MFWLTVPIAAPTGGVTVPESYYGIAIVALLPLTAAMVVLQANPYHALVIRGILGAVAALAYALLGAADVALTEALVGTMLSITLYAVAVRSSLRLRLGTLIPADRPECLQREGALPELRAAIAPYYMRLESAPQTTVADLEAALAAREVHGILYPSPSSEEPQYLLAVRVRRLYEILKAAPLPEAIDLHYWQPEEEGRPKPIAPNSVEVS